MMHDRVTHEYCIRLSITRPAPTSFAAFHSYATANISDAFYKRQTLPHTIKPVYSGCPGFAGPAVTVQVTPGDELLPLKAIEIAEPGDVIVIVGAYSPRFCIWGGIMSNMAKARGIAGLVTDGLVRDVAQIRRVKFPVYAAGITPIGTSHDVPPGELNYTITLGTAEIRPGDLMVADEDGIVCIPQGQIEAVDAAVRARIEKEDGWLEDIAKTTGITNYFREMVDRKLAGRVTHIDK